MAENLQDIEEKIKQVERKLGQVSKHLELNYQINKHSELADKELLETKLHLEKALLVYDKESKLANEEKLSQKTIILKLEQGKDEICSKHAATREELKKVLLSLSLTLNPIKPVKTNKNATKGGGKMETPLENEIKDEQLDEIFGKQAHSELKVIKLRSKHFCRAKLHEEASSSLQQYCQEIKFLELYVLQENLTSKLELAHHLRLKQCQLKDTLEMTQENATVLIKSMAAENKSLRSDLIMSQLSFNQASTSYTALQAQHSDLWNQVEVANTTGDLTDLTSLHNQQRKDLHSINQEMKNMRRKCEFLDKRLDYYSNTKMENRDDEC